jgi:hypothetical protein
MVRTLSGADSKYYFGQPNADNFGRAGHSGADYENASIWGSMGDGAQTV